MRGYQHRLSHQLVRNHQTICIVDTQTQNLTRSAKGTTAKPGANVSQKTGLNRSILAQGWYGLRTKLEYKAETTTKKVEKTRSFDQTFSGANEPMARPAPPG